MPDGSETLISLAFGRFGLLEAGDAASLAGLHARTVQYAHGEKITGSDAQFTNCSVIVSGMALSVPAENPCGPVTAIHVPADAPDLGAVIAGRLDHDIVAQGECLVQHVPADALRKMATESPGLAAALWRRTTMDARIHRAWLAAAHMRTTPRIAHLISELHARLERVGLTQDGSFRLPIEQKDMTRILGISRAHGNRSVQTLRAAGLIEWTRGRIRIHNLAALHILAHFDPGYLFVVPAASRAIESGTVQDGLDSRTLPSGSLLCSQSYEP
jgi:CRP-like cAMP-binding protein